MHGITSKQYPSTIPLKTKPVLAIPNQTKPDILKGTLHQNMKFTSYVRFDPQILPIFFFFPYDLRGACGSISGSGACISGRYGWIAARPICAHRKYLPDAQLQIAGCATTDRRMRNYRSPDAQLQITGCARSRAGNAAASPTEVVRKKEKYRQYLEIKPDI